MENHFIDGGATEKWYHRLMFILLVIITLGFAFILFYDVLMDRKYYINRKRLIKRLKNGDGTLVCLNQVEGFDWFEDIICYVYTLDDVNYKIWLWQREGKDDKVTLSSDVYNDYIGLFTASSITRKQNRVLANILYQRTPEVFGH